MAIFEVPSVMPPSVVFVCRQSPDWQGMSRDQRRGRRVDPARYVPDHYIPGFPDRVDLLIERWNNLFKIDFFTFRYILSDLSRRNIASILGARCFNFDDLHAVADGAKNDAFYVYFHDDDDFFAPNLPQVIRSATTRPDAIVTPMFRVACESIFTFARDGCTPDFMWGRRRPHQFRYQTCNYGLSSRRCTTLTELSSLKDHVLASRYADQNGYCDELLPSIISATVKTPAAASGLPIVMGKSYVQRLAFEKFFEYGSKVAELPESYDWISEPVRAILRVVESVYRGDGYDAISDLL